MSILYIVATPIGNLEDITMRALRILLSVHIVLCEDTRTTMNIFKKYSGDEISSVGMPIPKLLSYHSHSKISKVQQIIGYLRDGKNIALVSDAGTPGISDPGAELVSIIRREMAEMIRVGDSGDTANGIKIESIPGPSAITTALSIAGVPCADFTFLGFLPHKKGRETLFKEIISGERTYIFYESPHRIMKTLKSLTDHMSEGNPQTFKITVCRELTKIFEEVVQGSPEEVLKYFTENAEKVRGEFVVIVSR